MAAAEEQFACLSTYNFADFRQSAAPVCVTVSANSLLASNARQQPCAETGSLERPIDKIINKRNANIALFIMLILLLTLQAPVCCADIVTSQSTLPPAAEQALRPAQVTDAPVLELAAIAPASGPRQLATAANEDIKTDAATTFATVAGSGFVKIANTGETLGDDAAKWECVEDKNNNLVWETKKNDGGIRDKDFSYSWLHNMNGESNGISNGGRCKGGVNCDTSSYVRAMNEQKLCSYSDWRLPTRKELETLVEYNNSSKNATINKTFFPEAVPSWYWTASEHPQSENHAWYVLFQNGVALNDLKERPKHVRLVRGNRAQ